MNDDKQLGFDAVPDRYNVNGKEAIDIIREAINAVSANLDATAMSNADKAFALFCLGCAKKYQLRAGKKGTAEDAANDERKHEWYLLMFLHTCSPSVYPDPRSLRAHPQHDEKEDREEDGDTRKCCGACTGCSCGHSD